MLNCLPILQIECKQETMRFIDENKKRFEEYINNEEHMKETFLSSEKKIIGEC